MTDNTRSELVAAVRDFIDNSPIGDDDQPYCSDVSQHEFKRLVAALRAADALESSPPVTDEALRELLCAVHDKTHNYATRSNMILRGVDGDIPISVAMDALRSLSLSMRAASPPVDTGRVTEAAIRWWKEHWGGATVEAINAKRPANGCDPVEGAEADLICALSTSPRISTSARDEALDMARRLELLRTYSGEASAAEGHMDVSIAARQRAKDAWKRFDTLLDELIQDAKPTALSSPHPIEG